MAMALHIAKDTEIIIITKSLEESHYIRVIALAQYIPFVHYKFLVVLFRQMNLEHLLNGELCTSRFFSGKNNLGFRISPLRKHTSPKAPSPSTCPQS